MLHRGECQSAREAGKGMFIAADRQQGYQVSHCCQLKSRKQANWHSRDHLTHTTSLTLHHTTSLTLHHTTPLTLHHTTSLCSRCATPPHPHHFTDTASHHLTPPHSQHHTTSLTPPHSHCIAPPLTSSHSHHHTHTASLT